MKYIYLLLISVIISTCKETSNKPKHYENQIGDTPFNKKFDNPKFKFCDSTKVLHKRAFINYEEGMRVFHKEILNNYKYDSSYKNFSGFFIIRFAVNCKNKAGRYRIEVLDTNFNLINCPKDLKNNMLSLVKTCNKWKHAIYNGEDYDGYKFITIKMVNGKIELP